MSQHDQENSPTETLHDLLRVRREKRGVAYSEVEAATNIRANVIRSIEEGRWDQLPQPYMRSFVRKYGAFLDLPAEQLESLMDSTFASMQSSRMQPSMPDNERGAFRGNDLDSAFSTPANSILTKIVYAGIIVAVLSVAIYFLLDSPEEDISPLAEVSPAVEPIDVGSAAAGSTGGEIDDMQPITALGDSLTLRADASAEIWISMVMDGRKSWEGILQAGESINWKAKENFKLTLGNAGAVSFYFLGEHVPPLGSKVMRDVLVNRQGIFASNGRVFTPRHLRAQSAPKPDTTAADSSVGR